MVTQEKSGFTIGQIVELLKDGCPDMTASKLRFWEREKLISPRRTKGGHRLYSQNDVDNLRFVSELRLHRRFPLPAVKALVKRLKKDPTYRFVVLERTLHSEPFDPNFHPLSRSEAAEKTGVSEDQISVLEKAGLLLACPETGKFDEEAIQLMRILAELMEFSLTPEALSFYARSANEVVQHEHNLFADLCRNGNEQSTKLERYRRFRELIGPLQHLLYLSYLRKEIYGKTW